MTAGVLPSETRDDPGLASPARREPLDLPAPTRWPRSRAETREIIIRFARDNPTWGYRRIHGELAQLAITIAASTVWATLKQADIDPAPNRSSESWKSGSSDFSGVGGGE